jgi:adenosylcobyric acid synthase
MEGKASAPCLGILPIRTTMQRDKITVNAAGKLTRPSLFGEKVHVDRLRGYEIHIGETTYLPGARPFATLERESEPDQAIQDGSTSTDERTFGSYLHGLFDQDAFRHEFLRAARTFHKLAPAADFCDWRKHRERTLDRLASEVSRALYLKTIFKWVGLQYGVD